MAGIIQRDGKHWCENCGASCEPNKRNRFAKRHPKLCVARREFTRQLAEGTKSADFDELLRRQILETGFEERFNEYTDEMDERSGRGC